MYSTSSRIVRTLKQVPLLSTCTNEQLSRLASRMTRKKFSRNEKLMSEGEVGNEFFIIAKGECDVVYGSDFKKVASLGAGDYCGEQALVNDTVRNATVLAKTDVIALRVDQKTFKNLIQGDFGIEFVKRNAICSDNLDSYKQEENVDRTKSAIERKWIWYTISGNTLFANLTPAQKGSVIDTMFRKNIKSGENLINQGENGDYFYVIRQGKFEITRKKDGLLALANPGDCVGELALLYNAPRAATVKCISDGVVWCLHRMSLRKAIKDEATKSSQQNINFLQKVPLLSHLTNIELSRLDDALEEEIYKKSHYIIKQGDIGDKFYIIKKGQAQVEKLDSSNSKNIETAILSKGMYFGERALLTKEKRAASIIAHSNQLIVLSLTKHKFERLLGPLSVIMNRNMDSYNANLKSTTIAKNELNKKRINSDKHNPNNFSSLENLQTLGLLGRGGYGLVKLVLDNKTNKTWALKEVRKDKIVETQQTKHINDERKIMLMFDSPFLVNLGRTYQDKHKIYFLIDPCLGGDLFTILRKAHSFKEVAAKFYSACVIEGFAHMHSMNICYRDLKPENLVLDSRGYCKITDFGFCKIVENKTFTLCGTPDYLAPEIIMGRGHNIGVDYWTLGILLYEMLASMPPFYDREPTNIYRKIIRSQVSFPGYFSSEAKDLIKKLLKKRPTERLGLVNGGINNIRNHPWFKGFDWKNLQTQTMTPPYKPKVKSQTDTSNFKCKSTKEAPFKIVDDKWAKDF